MYILADNITSPLGNTTLQNYLAVKAGRSALRHYQADDVSAESYTAARFTPEQWSEMAIDGLTRFEALAVRSAQRAIGKAGIDITRDDVVFILSTTKANIESLKTGDERMEAFNPATAAENIAAYLGVTSEPIVVCNACISGVAAIITANRLLISKACRYAVVCGADVLSRFTFSGFQSLKALSADECRPFDIERIGLNLGEAAATMILSAQPDDYQIVRGAIRNDAFHISSPSKNADGAHLALQTIGAEDLNEELAFVNAHGTATLFNDQMEAVALERAGLNHVPTNSLKGFFGHTMGAAGVLETIISLEALKDNTVLASRGFEENGTSVDVNIAASNRPTTHKAFIKMISGFGGGNAAILVARRAADMTDTHAQHCLIHTSHSITVDPHQVTLDGQTLNTQDTGKNLLVEIYKRFIGDYPKFYKMDPLSRLGFVASELLLRAAKEKVESIILFNNSSSAIADRLFWATVSDKDNSFPSPAHFVYTLPNIVIGEIAMRNGIHGETSFYIIPRQEKSVIDSIIESFTLQEDFSDAIAGWIDYPDDEHFVAELNIIVKS